MTFLSGGIEYLDDREMEIWNAVRKLNLARRTTNNSQVANHSGLSRNKVAAVTRELKMRGYLRDVSKGAAYHWRVTDRQPVAWSARAYVRDADGELADAGLPAGKDVWSG